MAPTGDGEPDRRRPQGGRGGSGGRRGGRPDGRQGDRQGADRTGAGAKGAGGNSGTGRGSGGRGGGSRGGTSQGRGGHGGGSQGGGGARPRVDRARVVAFDAVRAVSGEQAYANLVLPRLLRERRLEARDAAFATELAYGALRGQGTYDQIIDACIDRPLDQLDPPVLDALRLGAHQLLAMRVPNHAAVSTTVDLVRVRVAEGAGRFVNAVMRRVGEHDIDAWADVLAGHGGDDPVARLAFRYAHPPWIVRAFQDALARTDGGTDVLEECLAADNVPAAVTLAVRPGRGDLAELLDAGAERGRWSPYAAVLPTGDPAGLAAVRAGRAGVQDEGSQLVALALVEAPLGVGRAGIDDASGVARDRDLDDAAGRTGEHGLDGAVGRDTGQDGRVGPGGSSGPDDRWLDMCAGPGGKAALLGGLATQRGARLLAVDRHEHRARLVEQALHGDPGEHEVLVADATDGPWPEADFDRVMLDAPCSGLGALRRRPEARWRRQPSDIAELRPLQTDLLRAAVRAVRPGGVVAYVTCSPHLAETVTVVDDVQRERDDVERLDARAYLPDLPGMGDGPDVQLWPHVHGTDAMYLALLRRL